MVFADGLAYDMGRINALGAGFGGGIVGSLVVGFFNPHHCFGSVSLSFS